MQVICFVIVDRMNFSDYQVAFLHDLSHVELIFFILFSLLGNVSGVQGKIGKCTSFYIDLPSFVRNFHQKMNTSCTLPTTMSPTWGLYLAFKGLTMINLFVISTVPRTDAWILLSTRYVPWPLSLQFFTS